VFNLILAEKLEQVHSIMLRITAHIKRVCV